MLNAWCVQVEMSGECLSVSVDSQLTQIYSKDVSDVIQKWKRDSGRSRNADLCPFLTYVHLADVNSGRGCWSVGFGKLQKLGCVDPHCPAIWKEPFTSFWLTVWTALLTEYILDLTCSSCGPRLSSLLQNINSHSNRVFRWNWLDRLSWFWSRLCSSN